MFRTSRKKKKNQIVVNSNSIETLERENIRDPGGLGHIRSVLQGNRAVEYRKL